MPEIKSGPLSRAELQAIWEGAVDKGYREPFLSAGEGRGFEVWTQLFAQLERASVAVDTTTQAMFISPWSGQTNSPASGAQKARVTLYLSRTKMPSKPLYLQAGALLVEEMQVDAAPDKGVEVLTGRRYVLEEDLVFQAGEQGPFQVVAVAERPGYGYNNPLPGTISFIPQPGAGFSNNVARVTVDSRPAVLNGHATVAKLVADNQPDMFVPDHVGQYVLFTAGANAGKVARMTFFHAPQPSAMPPVGSAVDLDLFWSTKLASVFGSFSAGETLRFASPDAFAACRAFDPASGRLAFSLTNGGSPAVGTTVEGMQSGATATIEVVLDSLVLVPEAPSGGSGGASWRVLDWVEDWNLTSTNPESPRGGLAGFLDELGNERSIARTPGEDDESYRARVREIADVVTPNAIRRALNRALSGLPWCLREVGQANFRGLFLDGTGEPPSDTPGRDRCDALDYDAITYTGQRSSLAFLEGEPVAVEDPATFGRVVEGYYGRIDKYASFLYGAITIVRKRGRSPSSLDGYRVRGLLSGATWTIDEEIENRAAAARRSRVLLSYEDFRAYFLVGLPRITAGDFGMAYDAGSHDAYDAAPFANGFDGYATSAPPIWLRAQRAVDHARAGGVGFDVYVEDSGCVPDDPDGEPLYLIDPLSMEGIVGYWREDELFDDGSGTVDSWPDATGNGHDWAQSSAPDRPEFLDAGDGICARRKGVRFDGTKWLELASSVGSTSGWTLVFVGAPTSFAPSAANPENVPNTLFGDAASGTAAFGAGMALAGAVQYVNAAGTVLSTNSISLATPLAEVSDGKLHVCAVRHAKTDGGGLSADFAEMNHDGLRETQAGYAWADAGFDRLGIGFGGADGFAGEVYAALLFSRPLTAKELRLLFYRFQVMYF